MSAKTLTEIFTETETISHGAFKVVKPFGAPWRAAHIFAHDKYVDLTATENKVMALLIARQGALIHPHDLSQEQNPKKGNNGHLGVMSVHISNIKKAIRNVAGPETADLIHSENDPGWSTRAKRSVSAYRLLTPDA